MAQRIVVIGASAGGIEALRSLVGALPADFPAPIGVVIHTPPQSPAILHEILGRAGPLRVVKARNGLRLEAATMYVAPPDNHLVIEPGSVRLTKGPRENRFRPAIDPLFRSAAQVYGPAAIGIVLTGDLDDGTAGLLAVKQLGGTAIVQDPSDALFPSMPTSALAHVRVDHCVPLADMVPLLARLTMGAPGERPPAPETIEVEVEIAKEKNALEAGLDRIASPSSFACPECHGVLLRLKEQGLIRFRCHTGHAYSVETLLGFLTENVEASLWTAIRGLEEIALLAEQISPHLETHSREGAERLRQRGREAHRQATAMREHVRAVEALPLTNS
jgi:two-component system chemotaxis response regulator CheB